MLNFNLPSFLRKTSLFDTSFERERAAFVQGGSWSKDVRRVSVSGDQTKAHVTGLHPAHSYQLRVVAENSVGTSNASDVVSVTTSEEVPGGPPRDVKIKVRNSEALLVSWKAYNRAGAGPRSQQLVASTDEDVPGAPPTDVQCTALSAYSILVLWSPPPETEINGILLGYRVIYHALSNWDDMFTVDEQTTIENKIELLDLTPFCNYSIEVKAFTRKGDGVPSRPIFCRTQEDVGCDCDAAPFSFPAPADGDTAATRLESSLFPKLRSAAADSNT
ncbi:Down syndrome cell adhesion molecule homolog [Schistocerca americana]|uniref:Down syndrome cell adhesion molecule homolog n=1 Tax=Schistocerca americana TaxID=7009 RepID=UPI001F500F71|nr:Down syndrome cell adhesion molecule homolog [Schistocerca americana]